MTPRDDFFLHIQSHPYFQIFVNELKRRRPIVPSHDPESDNTEKWKSLSAQQRGYDLCLSLFSIKLE